MFCSKSQCKKKSSHVLISSNIFQGGGQRERGGGDDGPAWNLGEKSPGCVRTASASQQYRVGC